MKPAELGEEIALELEALEATVKELLALQRDVARREPTVRERTAAAAFLAQFYNGTENILKRISHYHDVPLPTGEAWHVSSPTLLCTFPSRSPPAVRQSPGVRAGPISPLQARGLPQLRISARLGSYGRGRCQRARHLFAAQSSSLQLLGNYRRSEQPQ